MNTAPLQGIKVVDFTNVQSGPLYNPVLHVPSCSRGLALM